MTLAAASGDNSRNLFATPAIVADRRADGSIVVRSTVPLQPGARCIGDWLEHWARQAPERIFLADRASADAPWTTVTYQDALQQVRAAAAWILAQGLSAERPLVILSDNSVEHALFALAAQHVGVPVGRDLAGLFADVQGFRQAQEHDHAARARRDLCFRHKAVCGGAGGDQAAAFGDDRQRQRRRQLTRSRSAASRPRRKRPMSKRHLPRSRPTRSQNSCSRQARPARQRPSSTPSAC